MTLNSSGPISLGGSTAGQSIALELGLSSTATITLNDAAVRSLAGVPSGAIVMPNDFWGKSSATYYFTVIYANAGAGHPVSTGAFSVNSDKSVTVYGRVDNTYLLQVKLNSSGTATDYKKGSLTAGSNPAQAGVKDSSNNIYFPTSPYLYKFDSTGALQLIYTSTTGTQSFTIDNSGYIWGIGNSGTNGSTLTKYNSSFVVSASYLVISGTYTVSTLPKLARNYSSAVGLVYTVNGYAPCCCYWSPYIEAKPSGAGAVGWAVTGSNSGEATGVNTDSSGNVYWFDGAGYLTKFNSSGIEQWSTYISGFPVDYANGPRIEIDSSSNVYLVSEINCVIVKFNSSGVTQWTRKLNNTTTGGYIYVYDAQISPNDPNALYITGLDSSTPSEQGFVFKIPTDGSLMQTFTIHGNSYSYVNPGLATYSSSGYTSYADGGLPTTSVISTATSETISTTTAYSSAVKVL
jgi:hypothetical protein